MGERRDLMLDEAGMSYGIDDMTASSLYHVLGPQRARARSKRPAQKGPLSKPAVRHRRGPLSRARKTDDEVERLEQERVVLLHQSQRLAAQLALAKGENGKLTERCNLIIAMFYQQAQSHAYQMQQLQLQLQGARQQQQQQAAPRALTPSSSGVLSPPRDADPRQAAKTWPELDRARPSLLTEGLKRIACPTGQPPMPSPAAALAQRFKLYRVVDEWRHAIPRCSTSVKAVESTASVDDGQSSLALPPLGADTLPGTRHIYA